MTITLLASVSLFALVVTGCPILSDEVVPAPSIFQTAVQAVFRVHPGQDDLELDAARFQFQKPKQQIEYLSELDAENVAAIASFEISPDGTSSFEAPLDDTRDGRDVFDSPTRVHDVVDEPLSSELVGDGQQEVPTDGAATVPLVVVAFSCIAALLALACIALMLYIINSLRSRMLTSKTAWELLPRFWRYPRSSLPEENKSKPAKERPSGGGCLLLQIETGHQPPLDVEEAHDLHAEDKRLYFDAISDMESEWDDGDEKYQDALDMTPLPLIHNLPLEPHASHPSHFDDPPLGFCPPDQLTADRSPLLMREMCSSPGSRPAWSVRAMDSPALGLPSCEGGGSGHNDGVDATTPPLPLIHPRRRAYRTPVPEFDIALAMQLRPGLGIGADAAWMVRFLMAIFGWFAVALTGNTNR